MLNLIVDESYAFDYLSILKVKSIKLNDSLSKYNYSTCEISIQNQLGINKYNEIIDSCEYKNILNINFILFDLISNIRIYNVSPDTIDTHNHLRHIYKSKLQSKFFINSLTEQKTNERDVTFNINDVKLNYFYHEYNRTWENERFIEVPIAKYFIDKFNINNCIELGAVMPYYGYECPVVIDPHDSYDKCHRINGLDYDYTDKNVVSISTIEHFKPDEYNNRKINDGFTCLTKIIKESSNYLITWPIGYNKILDTTVANSNIKYTILKRVNMENHWEVDISNTVDYKYGYVDKNLNGLFPYANAICIVTTLKEFNI